MILIKNGLIVNNEKLIHKDILIENDLISLIEDEIKPTKEMQIIDAKNGLIIPGGVDVHVHLREPGYEYKETIKSGTKSAAKGGITTILSMPNLKPCPDCLDNLMKQIEIIKKDAIINVYPYGAVTIDEKDETLADIDSYGNLVKAISDDGRGVNNLELLEQAMILAKKYNIVIASHAEDNFYKYAPEGEYVAVEREIALAKKIGCKYHFCHLSTKESFDLVRKARKEGFNNITCEVTPHHLILNEEMIKNGNWKMNPPLRSENNRLETVKALLDGTASMIASDHAPHSEEEKNRPYDQCLNGIIGLETLIPIIYTNFVKKGLISYQKFIDLISANPIKIFALPERKLEVGYKADIAVLDINNAHKYCVEEIESLGKNSPFINQEYYGFPLYTICDGKIVYKWKE